MIMAERQRSNEEALTDLDQLEDDIRRATDRAIRRFLTETKRAALAALDDGTLTAAAAEEFTLGATIRRWADHVDQGVVEAVNDAYLTAYREVSDGTITETSRQQAREYLGKVRDRLVRGIQPPLPEAAFDRVRVATSAATAEGWSKNQLSQRIAADLGWETHGDYWRQQKARADEQIDRALDSIGEPGNPAREQAKRSDPRIRELRRERNRAIGELDREESYWKTRSDRIARTEATGANGYASNAALRDEGRTHKRWVSTYDARTRPSHLEVSGQIVPIDSEFTVGGVTMVNPGDPSAPGGEVINCRCTIVGEDDPNPAPVREPVEQTPTPPAATPTDILSDEQLETEMGELMSDPDGMLSPRMDELTREMDRRDANRLEAQANQRARDESSDPWGGGTVSAADQEAINRLRYGTAGPPKARVSNAKSREAALRQDYETWIETQFVAAEEATNGFMLSPEGLALERAGKMSRRDLFTRERRSLRYASEELQAWFAQNQRLSFPEFRAGVADDAAGRKARQRLNNRGWESEFG